jgi:uncharacterized protein YndB with AHSA1/START domain
MTDRSVTHATFVVERTYPASPSRVFNAWADPKAKALWFGGPEGDEEHELDFRVGGNETSRGSIGGDVYLYEAIYHDIVEDERIVYAYDMYMNDARISVSLGTIELTPDGDGTRLVYTEKGAFLDGHDTPEQRQEGTESLFDALGQSLVVTAPSVGG